MRSEAVPVRALVAASRAIAQRLFRPPFLQLLALTAVPAIAAAILGMLVGAEGLSLPAVLGIAGWVVIWLLSTAIAARRNHGADELADLARRSVAAEAANSAKSRYLSNVSHEIRSPLNAIYGYAQLIERSDGDGAREAARVIRRSAEHLTSLVEGLLDISQLENGVMRIKSDPVNLREFIDQICSMLRPEANAKGLTLHAAIPERLPELVRMDQSRLRQVLINLLSNAIKFTARGSVSLQVKYANQIAVFAVVDTGPGIAPADRERIFVPFERGAGEDQQRRPGVGLGLPIAKAIVEILGGQLELESEPGSGSCFRVTLMLGEVAGTRTSQPAAMPAPAAIVGHEGRPRSILLVDDDGPQLSFMRALLGSLGFTVTAVADGETAATLGGNVPFDLAILDIGLPGISGWDTAERLREAQGEDLQILMLSANVQEYHRPTARRPAHDMFLVKPVEFNTLLEAVGGLLELTWKRSDAAARPPAARDPSRLGADAQPYIERIREFLSIGHFRGVEKAIGELAENVPAAAELAASLLDSLDRFDLSALARTLEDC